MRESVPTNEPDAQNRRSTRVVQAVPLTVIGTDALGRPFQERTSTLIINCHGCRYQSKHYVLKNMWVTLEVPHPESGRPPRNVRGRVMWIQRPRNVRELFQVGVELEVTGNFWGIAFPPADWFPFPEGVATVPAPPIPTPPIPALSPAPALPDEASWPAPSPASASESNVRTMPLVRSFEPASPAVEPSAATEVAKVVEETRQELQTLVRRSAAEAVSVEARPLIAQLEQQLKNLAEKTLETAAGPVVEKAFEHAKKGRVDAFVQEYTRGMAESAKRAAQQFASQLDELEKDRSATFEHRLGKVVQEALEQFQKRAVDADLSAAADRWQQQVEGLVESARQQFVEKLARHVLSAGEHIERELSRRADTLLEAQSHEMARRVEQAVNSWSERLQPALEATGKQTVTRLAAQIKADLNDQVHTAGTMISRLENSEKKVHMQMQAVIDKGTESALAALKDKAGEMSSIFGSELDRYSRSYVEHTQQLVEETARESLERIRRQAQEMAESAMALQETTIDEYRRKLDSASNSWLLTTVAKLSQQTDQHVQTLTKAAEERLRAACTEVFSGVGDALRRGLLDVDPPPAPTRKTDK